MWRVLRVHTQAAEMWLARKSGLDSLRVLSAFSPRERASFRRKTTKKSFRCEKSLFRIDRLEEEFGPSVKTDDACPRLLLRRTRAGKRARAKSRKRLSPMWGKFQRASELASAYRCNETKKGKKRKKKARARERERGVNGGRKSAR